jgi:HD-GYP domain-containing protein (c-di-GMP phosphodiesterase class II)
MTARPEYLALPEHAQCRLLVSGDAGVDVTRVVDGLQALGYIGISNVPDRDGIVSRLAADPQDLVLLVAGVSDIWALATLGLIRQQFSAAELPVLLVSSNRTAALLAGASDCLSPPLDPVELCLRVKNQLTMHTQQQQQQRTQATLRQDIAARSAKLDMLIENGLLMSLTRERSTLIRHTLFEGQRLLHCDCASMYLVTDQKTLRFVMRTRDDVLSANEIAMYDAVSGAPDDHHVSTWCATREQSVLIDDIYQETRFDLSGTRHFDAHSGYRTVSVLTVPMAPHKGEVVGVLQFINKLDPLTGAITPFSPDLVPFVEALAAQAAVTLDNLQLLDERKASMESLIRTIATAIDAKSPYTARHSERVPELAVMLAEAAHAETRGPLAAFSFQSEDEWHEFRVGAWLHDCGKITTPEHVIDKATKLEMIYNRIHEVRMRFEVLLRDADLERWQSVARGGDVVQADAAFAARQAALTDDFAFIAKSNIGVENMSPALQERVRQIAKTSWWRHFDDRLGLAQEELLQFQSTPAPTLPAMESLLADRPCHIIARSPADVPDPSFGFKLDMPVAAYNHGEIYNLSVVRGTLTAEDRYKINEHMTHGITMLERMPFPKALQRVPEYAGTHHETLKGTGYPRRLGASQLSVPARIMMIADIFEALTAADRPYKTPKKFSEALQILYSLKVKGHIDADLFDLFLTSGVHLKYALKFLAPEQIDPIDIQMYLGAVPG